MKLSEVKIGDRIRVHTEDQGDKYIAEFNVLGIEYLPASNRYRFSTPSATKTYGEYQYGTRVELVSRPKTPGEQAFDGYYLNFNFVRPAWDALSEDEKNRWESAAKAVLDNCKD